MTESDILYRAFRNFFGAVEKSQSVSKMIDAVVAAPKPAKLTVIHNVCNVDEDWLDAIERGLVFIGRAIDESRQFIRSEGEIQPIEKVKRISKESVQHLSKHSDLITRKQKEEEIVPDKLYTIQRESDYAVYENRFLYLLLGNIQRFVSVRYEAINAAYKEYRGEYEAKKSVVTATRRLDFGIKLIDEQDDVVSAPADRRFVGALERMDKILQSVSFYLNTPLMTEVSQSHKISGNITKTNVLLMNKNFHEALLLYEYLTNYDKDGYSVERSVETFDPVLGDDMRELSAPVIALAFLVYEHGLKLEDYLKAEYEKEEQRLKEEAQKELVRKINELKKRIESSGKGVEEYMLALEERIKDLEKNIPLLNAARAENEELKGQITRLEDERKVLLDDIEGLKGEIARLEEEFRLAEEEHRRELERVREECEREAERIKGEYEEEITRIKTEADENMSALIKRNEEETAKIRYESEEKLAAQKADYEQQFARLNEAHASELSSVNSAYVARLSAVEAEKNAETDRLKSYYEAQLSEKNVRLVESESGYGKAAAELSEVRKELDETKKIKDVLQARLTAVRKEYGLLTEADDFTTEEGFNALEHEFEVLGRLVREEWTEVKKMLKKEFYAGLREATRKKKPQKTKEYEELKRQVLARGQKSGGQEDGSQDAPEDTRADGNDDNG